MVDRNIQAKRYWNDTCVYCLKKLNQQNRSKEHIIPKSRGGKQILFNIVFACKECNQQRDSKKLDDFASIEVRNHVARYLNAAMLNCLRNQEKATSSKYLSCVSFSYFKIRESFSSDVRLLDPINMYVKSERVRV